VPGEDTVWKCIKFVLDENRQVRTEFVQLRTKLDKMICPRCVQTGEDRVCQVRTKLDKMI